MNRKDSLPLGKQTEYINSYTPSLLCPIPRETGRIELGIGTDAMPFKGLDIWNAYELSWLEPSGKPVVAAAEIQIPADSPNMVESKSLKLYLNSFSQTTFKNRNEVMQTIEMDLSVLVRAPVMVKVILPEEGVHIFTRSNPPGKCIDQLEIETQTYEVDVELLELVSPNSHVTETLNSHLLRSNCPVTQQPDWGTVVIAYSGNKISPESLLKYIISYRHHSGFHEQCVEQIFMDIKRKCAPESLSVYARYTRRGGIDINPYRSDSGVIANNFFTFRQ